MCLRNVYQFLPLLAPTLASAHRHAEQAHHRAPLCCSTSSASSRSTAPPALPKSFPPPTWWRASRACRQTRFTMSPSRVSNGPPGSVWAYAALPCAKQAPQPCETRQAGLLRHLQPGLCKTSTSMGPRQASALRPRAAGGNCFAPAAGVVQNNVQTPGCNSLTFRTPPLLLTVRLTRAVASTAACSNTASVSAAGFSGPTTSAAPAPGAFTKASPARVGGAARRRLCLTLDRRGPRAQRAPCHTLAVHGLSG